jgi:hypothetical protein
LTHFPERVAIWPLVTLALVFLPRWISRGGGPVRENGKTIFRLRPAMKAVCIFMFVPASGLLWFMLQDFSAHVVGQALMEGGIACIFFGAGFYYLSTWYFLDLDGLHAVYWFGWKKMIPWASLTQYEIRRDSRSGTDQYFLRSKDGKSISITDVGHNGKSFLSHVKLNHPLRNAAYKRRHWWGG